MKCLFVLILVLNLVAFASEQTAPPGNPGLGNGSAPAVAPQDSSTQNGGIRILTPVANQRLENNNAINVRYELVNSVLAGEPSFLVQLDGTDPVRTTSTEQAFTGLAPGAHSVTVQLLDASGTSLPASTATVNFEVALPTSSPSAQDSTPQPEGNTTSTAAIPVPSDKQAAQSTSGKQQPQNSPAQQPLPPANSTLPLISVIGFGVLIGGIASAMRTR